MYADDHGPFVIPLEQHDHMSVDPSDGSRRQSGDEAASSSDAFQPDWSEDGRATRLGHSRPMSRKTTTTSDLSLQGPPVLGNDSAPAAEPRPTCPLTWQGTAARVLR